LGVSLLVFATAPDLVRVLYGPAFSVSTAVLRWLAPLPLLLGLSNVLGVQTMLALRMKRTVSGIVLSAGAFNLVLLYLLASFFGAVGAGMSVLATEALVTVLMIIVLRAKAIPIFPTWINR
jgi:O-antigen/teichoic acid export membrane protein